MRYLGLSLGMAVLGLCVAFGTLMPPILSVALSGGMKAYFACGGGGGDPILHRGREPHETIRDFQLDPCNMASIIIFSSLRGDRV